MLDSLKIAVGAVSTKMFPWMSGLYFYDGRVQGTNGRVTIDSAVDAPDLMGLCVPGKTLYKAVRFCRGKAKFKRTDDKLRIIGGAKRFTLPLTGR